MEPITVIVIVVIYALVLVSLYVYAKYVKQYVKNKI